MTRTLTLLTAALTLAGCQHFITPSLKQPAPNTFASTEQAPIEYASFDQQTLFTLLSAELAGQRNRFDIALPNYLEQARKTQDASVAERSLRIAEYLGAEQAALESAEIWSHAAPDNLEAQRALIVQLARAGRHEEAIAALEKIIQGNDENYFDTLAIASSESDDKTQVALLQSFNQLLSKYPGNSQLVFGKAILLQKNQQSAEALALLENDPNSSSEVPPLLLRARLLDSLERGNEAIRLLRQGQKQHPDDRRINLAYARQLIELERFAEAKSEFINLLQQNPNDDDLRLSLALICLESQSWDEGIYYLEQLIERERHVDLAYLNLGRAYQAMGQTEQALSALQAIEAGEQYLPALAQQSQILIQAERLAEANQLLSQARQNQPQYSLPLYLLEIETLAKHHHFEAAWQLSSQALKTFPEDSGLLYSRALLAEKRDDLSSLERNLRNIIEHDPNNAAALNALGYTLADRTERFTEAKELIEKAHQLNPDDAATLDSLGWVHYRLGNLDEAERLLRQALTKLPDHEVAAHLGEVLWAKGKQREARKIWTTALQTTPDSPILRATILRLTGKEKP